MLNQIALIANFIVDAFVHLWPYLLITIPISVAVKMLGAAKYINPAFQARPMTAILLATAVGAFSPLCSCGVIPIVAALLIGGVPLAPVMSFWIASPSMDPEIFFLSVGTIGWQLAVWRLAATLFLSLSAGFMTHFVVQRGWLGERVLRSQQPVSVRSAWTLLQQSWQNIKHSLTSLPVLNIAAAGATVGEGAAAMLATACQCEIPGEPTFTSSTCDTNSRCDTVDSVTPTAAYSIQQPKPFGQRLWSETWEATALVVKFMALAFFLEAVITLFVPTEWIIGLLGRQNPLAIPFAALVGVPVYTSNLAALPMVSGLLAQGMNPAAALAFLIAGPTTTLPAMAAVWGIAARRVFTLYVSISFVGALVAGYVYSLMV